VPKAVVQERYLRLLALQEEVSWQENKTQVGRVLDVLVAEGEGRKDGATHRMSGRAPDNRLVHFAVPTGVEPPRPGDVATIEVTYAAPHHLVADGAFGGVRRTRAGDAWQARQGGTPVPAGVLLGMPTVGVPSDADRRPAAPPPRRTPGQALPASVTWSSTQDRTAGMSSRAEMLSDEQAESPALSTPTNCSPRKSGDPES